MFHIVSARVLVAACALSALPGFASAAITFQDGTFAPGTWALELFQQGTGGTATATQQLSGGNPGEAFRVQTTVLGASGGPSTIWAFHRLGTTQATRYDPAVSGAISLLDYSIDFRMITGFGQGHGLSFALKQGQNVYVAAPGTTGTPSAWTTRTAEGLTGSDFVRINGAPGSPDFSALGAPIRFGFVTSNSTSGSGYSITVDYDNFSVSVVPTPGTLGALGLATVALIRRRRSA